MKKTLCGYRRGGVRKLGVALIGLASVAGLGACANQGEARQANAAGTSLAVAMGAAERSRTQAGLPTIEQFFKIRVPGSVTPGPGGELYVRDFPDGINQLYRIPADAVGKADAGVLPASAKKLTTYKDGLSGFSLSPDKTRILLIHAVGGNENTQVSVLNLKDDSITPVLENPKVQHSIQHWKPDGSGFYYRANDASPNDFYLYRFDFAAAADMKGTSTKLSAQEGSWNIADVTTDGQRLLVTRDISASQQEFYEMTLKPGAEPTLNDLSIKGADGVLTASGPVGYLPDEQRIVIQSDKEEGIQRVFVMDLKTKALTKPLPSLDPFEIDSVSINQERTWASVTTNEDGYAAMHVYRLPDFAEAPLPQMEKGLVGLSYLRANTMVYSVVNARTPGTSYRYEILPPNSRAMPVSQQLTFPDSQGIDLNGFPLPELVKYKSFDGLEIPAFVFLPPGHQKGTKIPFVANYHGGPEGQFRPGFDRTVQFLLSRGYGVIQPNVRGSTGYGRAFQMMDDYKNRWNSVRDGVEAARWLVNQGYAEAGKIAAYGGSYGGFMAVATITEDGASPNPMFGASINVVGIVNMKTFLEQTSGYRRKLREVEYGPLTDPEFLASVSPINKIDQIKVPMFIAHGLNDPRVPVGEAMQLAVELQKRGYEPVQFYAPDEGHGFAKLDNRLLFARRMVKFLDDTIGK
jgi:prolyl oligopeptidase PreP (S9A serine peptidase family)